MNPCKHIREGENFLDLSILVNTITYKIMLPIFCVQILSIYITIRSKSKRVMLWRIHVLNLYIVTTAYRLRVSKAVCYAKQPQFETLFMILRKLSSRCFIALFFILCRQRRFHFPFGQFVVRALTLKAPLGPWKPIRSMIENIKSMHGN